MLFIQEHVENDFLKAWWLSSPYACLVFGMQNHEKEWMRMSSCVPTVL
jgi:hypothetical protein